METPKCWGGDGPLSAAESSAPGTFVPSLHAFLQGQQADVRLVVSKARLGSNTASISGIIILSWKYHGENGTNYTQLNDLKNQIGGKTW